MIWTVTPNPALDITYRVPRLERGESHRVGSVEERPGGKGLNVGLVARQLGGEVTFSGFLGGATGHRVEGLLDRLAPGAPTEWVRVPAETRRSIAVIDGAATLFNEAGTAPAPAAWFALEEVLSRGVAPGDVVAVSGSMPGATPSSTLVSLLRAARRAGAVVLLDTSGSHLLAAAGAADVLKPNAQELLDATGCADIASGAAALLGTGARCVLVSRGIKGIDAYTTEGHWHAVAGGKLPGNPTGAGDAAVASVAVSVQQSFLAGRDPLAAPAIPDLLLRAAATSASAVVRPVAGEVDAALRAQFLTSATVERTSHAL